MWKLFSKTLISSWRYNKISKSQVRFFNDVIPINLMIRNTQRALQGKSMHDMHILIMKLPIHLLIAHDLQHMIRYKYHLQKPKKVVYYSCYMFGYLSIGCNLNRQIFHNMSKWSTVQARWSSQFWKRFRNKNSLSKPRCHNLRFSRNSKI